MLAFQSPQGRNMVLLAVSGINDTVPVFQSTSDGAVAVNVRNDSVTEQECVILVAEGNDFEKAVAAVMYHARSLVTKARGKNEALEAELKALSDAVRPEWLDEWYDGLGYCKYTACSHATSLFWYYSLMASRHMECPWPKIDGAKDS